MQKEQAETIAIKALQHIAGSEELLVHFMALSGLTPATLRQAATDPSFLGAALDFIRQNETESIAFASNYGLSAIDMESASRTLTGKSSD